MIAPNTTSLCTVVLLAVLYCASFGDVTPHVSSGDKPVPDQNGAKEPNPAEIQDEVAIEQQLLNEAIDTTIETNNEQLEEPVPIPAPPLAEKEEGATASEGKQPEHVTQPSLEIEKPCFPSESPSVDVAQSGEPVVPSTVDETETSVTPDVKQGLEDVQAEVGVNKDHDGLEDSSIINDDLKNSEEEPGDKENGDKLAVLADVAGLEDNKPTQNMEQEKDVPVDVSNVVEPTESPTVVNVPVVVPDHVVTGHDPLDDFEEWKKKRMPDNEVVPDIVTEPTEIPVKVKSGKKLTDFALLECGAKVIASNPESKNAAFVLNENKDEYMINPCSAKKWFVVQLCEAVDKIHVIELANLELFSSTPETFKVYISDRHPVKDWHHLGTFHARDERKMQAFNVTLTDQLYAKYVKIETLTHYGQEHYCPLSIVRVYATSVEDFDETDTDTEQAAIGEMQPDDETDKLEDNKDTPTNLFSSTADTVLSLVKQVLLPGTDINVESGNLTSINDSSMILTNQTADGYSLPCDPSYQLEKGNVSGLPQDPEVHNVSGSNKHLENSSKDGGISQNLKAPQPLVTKLEDHEQQPVETDLPDVVTLIETPETKQGSGAADSSNPFAYCYASVLETTSRMAWTRSDKFDACGYMRTLYSMCTSPLCYSRQDMTPITNVQLNKINDSKKEVNISQNITENTNNNGNKTVAAELISDKAVKLEQNVEHKQVENKQLPNIDNTVLKVVEDTSQIVPINNIPKQVQQTMLVAESETVRTEAEETMKYESYTHVIDTSSQVNVEKPDTVSTASVAPAQVIVEKKIEEELNLNEKVVSRSDLKDDIIEKQTGNLNVHPTKTTEIANTAADQNTDVAADDMKQVENLEVNDNVLIHNGEENSNGERNKNTEQKTINDIQPSVPTVSTRNLNTETPSLQVPSSIETANEDKTETVPIISDAASETSESPRNMTEPESGSEPETKIIYADNSSVQREDPVLQHVPPPGTLIKKLMPKRDVAIMKLSNTIKALEANLSLTNMYLQELSQKYKKQREEMQRALNWTMERLMNTTREAEAQGQKKEKQILDMQETVKQLSTSIHSMAAKMDQVQEDLVSRHMTFVMFEIICIACMLVICLRKNIRKHSMIELNEIREALRNMPETPHRGHTRKHSIDGAMGQRSSFTATISQRATSEKQLSGRTASDVESGITVIQPTESFWPDQIDTNHNGAKKKKKRKSSHSKLFHSKSGTSISPNTIEMNHSSSKFSSAGLLFGADYDHSLTFDPDDCRLDSGVSSINRIDEVGSRESSHTDLCISLDKNTHNHLKKSKNGHHVAKNGSIYSGMGNGNGHITGGTGMGLQKHSYKSASEDKNIGNSNHLKTDRKSESSGKSWKNLFGMKK